MKTTLNKIREHSPCPTGWSELLKNLGKTKADDETIAITTILESNGLADALWCLRAVDGYQREMRLFAVDCARMVQHLMTDKRSLEALDVAERHADGLATDSELDAARDAAVGAAVDATWAAAGDAWAAWAAAWSTARAAARAAVGAAAGAARDAQSNLLIMVCADIDYEASE